MVLADAIAAILDDAQKFRKTQRTFHYIPLRSA